MRRRAALAAVFGVIGALPAARADGPARPHVALLTRSFLARDSMQVRLFLDRLRALGDVEGRDFDFAVHAAEDSSDEETQARAIVASAPDIIVVLGSGVDALRRLTRTIPIVVVYVGDPITSGYSTSWARPSENVTGVLRQGNELSEKLVQLMHELLPAARRLGLIYDPAVGAVARLGVEQSRDAARILGLELVTYAVLDAAAADLEGIPARADADGVPGLIVEESALITDHHGALLAAATARRVAIMGTAKFWVLDGALIAYGRDITENWSRTAESVHRLLHGAKVHDLPFQETDRVELSLNLRTARAIGVEIPPAIMARADVVIE